MSDTFPFECPVCGHMLNVPTKYVGMSGRCNKCGNSIVIELKPPPIPEQVAQTPPDVLRVKGRLKEASKCNRPHEGFVRKIAKQMANGKETLDIHFGLQELAQKYYAKRDHDPDALEIAAEACRQQIEMSSEAKAAWLSEYGGDLPAHHGFKQLSIILDKGARYEEAIEVCESAASEGWNGDWDKRIARYRKKLERD